MAGKVKTWVWVVLGIVVIGVLGVIAMAGVGLYFVSQHFDTKAASPANAAREFEQVKAKFTGQSPLIELDEHGRYLRSHTDRTPPVNVRPPDSINVLAFDPDDGRIVRVSIPFWVVRMKMRGATIDLNGKHMDLEDLKLTAEDLERFGPTLIVDHKNISGERVLVWSQ
jgi:anionic cell wall polymer biosynthesis LytR-Cps2A-Psr (LCP) family protein